MKKLNVLVVDDSAFMRKVIKDILEEHPLIQVIGTARDGKNAISQVKKLNPDVVTMDVEMPNLNGIEAVKIIMKECPVPIIMLSTATTKGAETTLMAMESGAIDFVTKPSGSISLDLEKVKDELIEKVISSSKVNMNLLKPIPLGSNKRSMNPPSESISNTLRKKSGRVLATIGTSTGGPRALQEVLTKLPKNIPFPIFIVQHMPVGFTKSLATRLNSICQITVKEAEDGELVQNGVAYIAPGGSHLLVEEKTRGLQLVLSQSEPINGHRPSVNQLFYSLAKIPSYHVVATVMTGMGNDGADGVLALKKAENVTVIAESSESAVIFGMPKAAIATGKVDQVSHLENIAETILKTSGV